MKKLSKYFLLYILSVLIFLTACSDGEDGKNKSRGENAIIALQMRQPETFNPLVVKNHSVRDAFSLCYEPLFEIGKDMNAQGVLATTIQVSDDCMSAVIILKDSVVWHDGIKFTSADVAHTVNVLKENPSWPYYKCVEYIDSVQVIDPLSLKLTLSRPYGQIVYSLSFPVIASHNSDIDTKIIGTGPYCMDKYTTASLLELKAFDSWHGGNAICRKVNVSIVRDAQTATTSFNTGLISAVTDESFDTRNTVPRKSTRITKYPSSKYEFMVMNHGKWPFTSQIVRSAISSAVNREAIVSECYNGNAVATNSPMYPVKREGMATSASTQYSLANTNELLFLEGFVSDESSGILKNENGREFTFELLVNSENPERISTAQLLRQQLFQAGINVNIREVGFEEYSKRVRSGEFDAYLGGIRMLNLYDFSFLLSGSGSMGNYGYSDQQMQTVLDALASSPSDESRINAAVNFEELFLREQPICGIAFKNDLLLTEENIKGNIFAGLNDPYRSVANWKTGK